MGCERTIKEGVMMINKSLVSVFLFAVCIFGLQGCSTPYQSLGFGGGYTDMRLNENTFKVSFRGNGYTSTDKVQNLLLRRCAELTLQSGYKYFVMLAATSSDDQSEYTTPTTAQIFGSEDMRMGGSVQNDYNGSMTYGGSGTGNYSASTVVTPGKTFVTNRYQDTVIIKLTNSPSENTFDAKIISAQFTQQ